MTTDQVRYPRSKVQMEVEKSFGNCSNFFQPAGNRVQVKREASASSEYILEREGRARERERERERERGEV